MRSGSSLECSREGRLHSVPCLVWQQWYFSRSTEFLDFLFYSFVQGSRIYLSREKQSVLYLPDQLSFALSSLVTGSGCSGGSVNSS